MRIHERFDELRQRNEAALILYYPAGYPTLPSSFDTIQTMAKNGADIIEIGIPFSDPIADGTTIQSASQTALRNGVTLEKTITHLKAISVDCPLVVMSYLNPLLAYGMERLLNDFLETGVTGLIIPDLPVEEANEVKSLCQKYHIDLIFLVTPASSKKRIRMVAEISEGFIYSVSLTGTTGARDSLSTNVVQFLDTVKSMTKKPVAVGFGISTPQHIELLRDHIDGVIIGSRMIKAVMQNEDIENLVSVFKNATIRT